MASNILNPLASGHIPAFITGPGETDVLFNVVVAILVVTVMLVGVFYFALHALPEKYAHKVNSRQLQMVAILSLIALFTHNNYFWIAALLLAAIQFPDFLSPLKSIAKSLENIQPLKNTEPLESTGPSESPGSSESKNSSETKSERED